MNTEWQQRIAINKKRLAMVEASPVPEDEFERCCRQGSINYLNDCIRIATVMEVQEITEQSAGQGI